MALVDLGDHRQAPRSTGSDHLAGKGVLVASVGPVIDMVPIGLVRGPDLVGGQVPDGPLGAVSFEAALPYAGLTRLSVLIWVGEKVMYRGPERSA
jgi:hypothetical protein